MSGPGAREEPRLGVVSTAVQGRFLFRRCVGEESTATLIGFHGYAENAHDHLTQLEQIPGAETWNVAAVQALHPFYNSRSGEVVASWMTRLDRERAIVDNVDYVARVVDRVMTEVGPEGPLVFAGFSQGTAMAYRAAAGIGRYCDAVIALGGDLPPEIETFMPSRPLSVLIGRGTSDAWYDETKLTNDVERLRSLGVVPEICRHPGGHEWTSEFRRAAGRFLLHIRLARE